MATLRFAQIHAAIDANPATIQHFTVENAIETLSKGTDLCELKWMDSTDTHCRAFIDLDGKLSDDTEESEFEIIDEAIKYILCNEDFGGNHSLLSASRFNYNMNGKKHKLSYRITFTNVCGTRDAVKAWTRDVVCKRLASALDGTIAFYNSKVPKDCEQYLSWDPAPYCRGKLRCWNATKPGENRPNVLIKGDPIDTLITYIPDGCQVLDPPVVKPVSQRVTTVENTTAPVVESNELVGDKKLIATVVDCIPVDGLGYEEWIYVGMALYNEELPVHIWDNWSAKHKSYRRGDCLAKWHTFKKGNITQSYLWALLKRTNIDKFKELQTERKDFLRIVENPTNYSVAEYFFNIRTNDYLYDSKCGWLGVMPNNIWENPTEKKPPATMKNKIARVLNVERILLETAIIKKKRACSEGESTDELDKQHKKCLAFRDKIESDSFQKGVIAFLSSFYAEQSYNLLIKMGVKAGDGVISIFDTNPNIFAFTDCLYDFTTKTFRPIEPTDYITITCGYRRPLESNPTVRQEILDTLTKIWEETETRDYLLTLIAICLNGKRNAEVFSILTGRGGNGKGLLWELVMRVFGGYYYQLPKQCLTKNIDSSTAATPDIAMMRGMRIVGTSEPEAEERLQEGTIKLLTGGDPLTARMLYGQPITFKPQFGLFIQANILPVFNQLTKAGIRRNRVIPFPFNFVAHPKLSYEREGNAYIKNVLCRSDAWRDEFMLLLLDTYYPMGENKQIDAISTPARVVERTNEYIEDNNKVGEWWKENYELSEGSVTLSQTILEDYKNDTKDRITANMLKAALAFNDIDIVKINDRNEYRGRMGVRNWRRINRREEMVE
jgi:P4 family phage/plasmid primase-like protien